MTYTMYMHGIYITYTSFSDSLVLQGFKGAINTGWIGNTCMLRLCCMDFQDNYSITLKRHDLLSHRIYQGYTRYIPCIYQTYTIRRSLASPPRLSCSSALGSLRPGLPSDLLSLGHWEAAHARLGPSKVPQPGVDLVNMAAPPRGRAQVEEYQVWGRNCNSGCRKPGLGKKLQQWMAATVHVLNRRMLPRLISSLSRHSEMLLLQEHNVDTWGWVMSLTKQIVSICIV